MEKGWSPGTPPPFQSPPADRPGRRPIPALDGQCALSETRSLLGAFSAPDPLAGVLDRILEALGASYLICASFPPEGLSAPGHPPDRVVGRRAGRRPIRRPERLLKRLLAASVEGDPRLPPLPPDFRRAEDGGWRLVRSLPEAGQGRAALFAGAPGPLPGGSPADPPARLETLLPWIAPAFEISRLRVENQVLRERLEASDPEAFPLPACLPSVPAARSAARADPPDAIGGEFPGIIAFSASLREVLRTVSTVAPSEATVLIEGESGTGKELIARAIHDRSTRAGGPFISESCAACPEGLLESEFFGVERGAFTGAHRTKPGVLERARAGTLFLDEIGEMDLKLQRKLLRALQEREVRRVGGSEAIAVDFRLISATNRVLSEEARAGRFRPDLFYRLEVVAVRLPPLRERPEDIPPLTRHFLSVHAASARRPPPELEDRALRLLCAYPWPGNVRELQNEMCRAVALGFKAITPASLSAKIVRLAGSPARLHVQALQGGRSLDDVERDLLGGLIREALQKTRGNKIRAAELLGIPKTTLYRRIRRYAIGDGARERPVREEPIG